MNVRLETSKSLRNIQKLYFFSWNFRCVFGGFTKAAWSSDYKYLPDDSSFLFSLKNASSDKPYIINCSDSRHAIYCGKDYGPCFGYSTCLNIWNWSNLTAVGQSELNYNYKRAKSESECGRFLAGEREFFIVKQIEVFQNLDWTDNLNQTFFFLISEILFEWIIFWPNKVNLLLWKVYFKSIFYLTEKDKRHF